MMGKKERSPFRFEGKRQESDLSGGGRVIGKNGREMEDGTKDFVSGYQLSGRTTVRWGRRPRLRGPKGETGIRDSSCCRRNEKKGERTFFGSQR